MQNVRRIDDPYFVVLVPIEEWTEEERAEMRERMIEADKFEKERAAEKIAIAARPVCPRCSGRGVMGEYSHVMNGKCFRCGGSGYDD